MRSNHNTFLQRVSPDWEKIPIEGYGKIFSGGTPSRENLSFWNGSIAWVTPSEITELDSKYLTSTRENISIKGLQNSGAKLLPSGSVLVTSRATIGAVAIAKIPITTNQGFKSIVPEEPNQSEYIYYLMNFIAPEFVRLATGSTFNEISRRDFVSIVVPHPSPVEQYRIATILDAVDKAISQTESHIAKLKQIKAGLIHDLLTRGVDNNGELRSGFTEAPNLYRETSLGWYPKDWDVLEIEKNYHE